MNAFKLFLLFTLLYARTARDSPDYYFNVPQNITKRKNF